MRNRLSFIASDCDCTTPCAAFASTGMFAKVTTPAFVSNEMLPIERLAIVVSEEEASTVKMSEPSLPIENTPTLSTVRKVVVVAEVEEPIEKRYWLVSPTFATSENLANGVEVPRPTLPRSVTTKFVATEEPTANAGAPEAIPVVLTESLAHGEVEPIPTKPLPPLI